MNQPPYQYPQNPPIQPAYPGAYIRRGRRGCLSRFRGCLVTLVILVLLLVSLWVVSLFVPIPYLVFVNPLPYFTKYSFVIHHGQSAVYAVAWSPNGKRVASVGQERTVQVWDATTGKVLFTYQASLNSPHIPIV